MSPLHVPSAEQIERALRMVVWARAMGLADVEAFYAERAAEMRRRVVGSAP